MIAVKEDYFELSIALQQSINADLANHFLVVPKSVTDDKVTFLCSKEKQSKEQSIEDELKLILNKSIQLEFCDDSMLQKTLSIYYRKHEKHIGLSKSQNDFLDDIIFDAKNIGASDIHIEVYDEVRRVRYRIDGKLIEKRHIPEEHYLELINQIKIKSNLDITEKRLPQDGRIEYDAFDLRVSVLPTHHGEKVVMRILGRDASHLDIEQLGMEADDNLKYLDAVKRSNGIVLISGPTGSGKTTTLYATLKFLNDINRNIVTVEDPIEYTLKGINQVQLKENIGLSFSSALRSFLRQDPDIIMLGEIRDAETAQMAIRASLTGHLVLSTIHTNSAKGTISRLIDMGVPDFLISETINISVAQRLVRLLCQHCKTMEPFDKKELPLSFQTSEDLKDHHLANGCLECHHTGYKGRRAIYEMLPVTTEVSEAIKDGSLKSIDFKTKSLADKAFQMMKTGQTSLEEVYSLLINY